MASISSQTPTASRLDIILAMSPTFEYWQQQTIDKPLFPDVEWNKPERRDQAGRLGIIGGNKLGFIAAAESYQTALDTGVGQVKVVVPDVLRRTIPASMTDVLFGQSNPSGGLAKGAITELRTLANWSDTLLLVGDAGRNSETAALYESFILDTDKPLVLTRDSIDLVRSNPSLIVDRKDTLIVASFAQTQKLFQAIYYPKILTFNMQLAQLVEALHKFTITYHCTIVTYHQEHLIIAQDGEVVTQEWADTMSIWRGRTATRAASYWIWHSNKALQAVAASLIV